MISGHKKIGRNSWFKTSTCCYGYSQFEILPFTMCEWKKVSFLLKWDWKFSHFFRPRRHFTNYVHTSYLASLESSKMFEFSSQLDLESRILLMKHATLICSNMMNAFFSINEMKSDILRHPDGSMSGHMRKFDRENDVMTDHVKLIQKTLITFLNHKVDKIEYLLFKAIMLCNPGIFLAVIYII